MSTDSFEIKTEIKANNGELTVYREQDVEPVLNANRAALNEVTSWRPFGSGRKDVSIRKVADIPNIVVEQWLKEGLNIFSPDPDMQKKFRQKLNSPEWRYLRTFPGKIRVTGK